MAIDISSLAIQIKSEGITKATQDLRELANTAKTATTSVSSFVSASNTLKSSVSGLSSSLTQAVSGSTAYANSLNAFNSAANQAAQAQSNFHNSIAASSAAIAGLSANLASIVNSLNATASAINNVTTHSNNLSPALERNINHGNILNNTFKSMLVAASAYMGVNFAKGIIEQADAWGQMQAKLKLTTGSMEGAKMTQQGLLEMAQRLRIPLENSVELYNRMAVPMMNLGKSGKEVMGVVEGVGMALKLSGATAQEASSVMLQFSQSMNAGRLNGAEFNAVAEGAPIILRAIEAELRRTGQGAELASKGLKKMASENKLDTNLLSDAINHANEKMRKDFESLPLTVDGAMQRIKNAWTAAIGTLAEDTKFNEKIAESIKKLEDILPSLAKTVGNAFSFLITYGGTFLDIILALGGAAALGSLGNLVAGVLAVVSAMTAATTATAALDTALLAMGLTPMGAAFIALGAAVAGAVITYKSFTAAAEESNKIRQEYLDSVPNILKGIQAETKQLEKQIDVIRERNNLPKLYEASTTGEEIGQMSKYGKALASVEAAEASLFLAKKAQKEYEAKYGSSYYYDKSAVTNAEQQLRVAKDNLDTTKAAVDLEMRRKEELAQTLKLDKAREVQSKVNDAITTKDDKKLKELKELRDKAIAQNKLIAQSEGELSEEMKKQITTKESLAKLDKQIKELETKDQVTFKKTSLDLDQKAVAALKEIKQAYEELEKYGLDDKRTAGEKQLVKLEADLEANIKRRAAATKDGTLAKLKEEEAIIRSAIATEKEVIAVEKQYNAKKDSLKQTQEDITAREKTLEQATKEADILEKAVANHGKLAKSKEEVNLEYALEEQALLSVQDNKEKELELNAKLIEQYQRTLTFRKQLDEQAMTDKAAKKYEADWQAANKKIGDGLYEALSSNGDSFVKKLVKDMKEWFARLVLSPIIQPIAAYGASLLNPLAASASGASAGGAASSMVSGVGNLFSSFMNLGTNFAGQIGSTLGSLGTKMGSDFLASVGGGINGAGVGSGLGSSIGLEIGSTLAPVLQAVPYIAAAYAVYNVLKSGFSMGEKQITGSNVTGTLGTSNINRNVNWSQQGGMFRSDRSGTWSYNLANSVAVADGVGYTDTASLASDKALLKALNDSYAALKTSTADYAKILGINADNIAARNDEMSFAIGKTADETNTNISNMFKEIGNNIAKGLLGTYSSLAKDSETAAETLTRLATEVTTVDAAVKTLGLTFSDGMMQVFQNADSAFSKFVNYTTEQLVTMKDALVQASGGLEAFLSQSAFFAQNFLSEAEKIKPSQDQVAKIFDQYHITNVSTIEDYKKLVQGIDLSTESGRAMYAALMLLAPTFKQVADYSGSSANSATALAEALANTNKSIQDQIDALLKSNMTTEQIRAAELTGVDASTAALLRRLYALQDEKAATEAASAAMEAAATKAKAVADERYGLETQLLQEEGKTDELRKRELDKLDPSNQELQKRIWALQDEKAATAAKVAADQKAADEASKAAEQAASAAKAVKDAWQSITNTIMDEVKRIRGLVDESSGTSFAEAQSRFAITTAQARAGDQEAAKLLPSLSQALLTLAEKNAQTAEELSYIRAMTANSLAQTAGGYVGSYGVSLPSFDVGTDSVPRDMIAQIHAGEEIVPAAYTGKNNSELVTEIKSLKEEMSKMRTENNAQQQAIAVSTAKTAKILTQNDFGQGILVTTSLPT